MTEYNDGKVGIYVELPGGRLEPTRYRAQWKQETIQVHIPVWETMDGKSVHHAVLIAFPREYKDPRGRVFIVEDFGFDKAEKRPSGAWYFDRIHNVSLYSPTDEELKRGTWAEPPKPANALERETERAMP